MHGFNHQHGGGDMQFIMAVVAGFIRLYRPKQFGDA
jgi:hypothetical protein